MRNFDKQAPGSGDVNNLFYSHEVIIGGSARFVKRKFRVRVSVENSGKIQPWIAQKAEEAGLFIENYEHEVSNYFIRHVLKNHGNEKTERDRGNLPITDEDFGQIPVIIDQPDYIIFWAKRDNEDRIIYIKCTNDKGTMLYFEEILTGKQNEPPRGKPRGIFCVALVQGRLVRKEVYYTVWFNTHFRMLRMITAAAERRGIKPDFRIKITGMNGG